MKKLTAIILALFLKKALGYPLRSIGRSIEGKRKSQAEWLVIIRKLYFPCRDRRPRLSEKTKI